MTIYSQHPQRGKVQVLATYRGLDGVVSETVTSLESAELAGPVVDALNRVSAAATVPVSVYDEREEDPAAYPRDHLAALTDSAARPALLSGAHSLWYVMVTWMLHEALTDLDHALTAVPAPVRTAVRAELETEAKWLRGALAQYSEGEALPDGPGRRVWVFDEPFVALVEDGLAGRDREMLDRVEAPATREEMHEIALDVRLLLDAQARSAEPEVEFDPFGPLLSVDATLMRGPGDREPLVLMVEAPRFDPARGRHERGISLQRWVDDEFDEDGLPVGATGEEVLYCEARERPSLADVVRLLDQARDRLPEWARTAVGDKLEGTGFVVTQRSEDSTME